MSLENPVITRKRGNCECIANWGRPSQVWRRIIVFLLLIHYFTPWPWLLILWPWPLTFDLEHLQRIVCDVMKICTKFERNRTICGGVIAISVFDLMTLNNMCCARLWDNIHKVWRSTTYPCLNYSVFWCWYVMSSCDLDLWPVALESSWYIKCHVIKVFTKFERNRAIPGWIIDNFANFCTRCHAMTLTFDRLNLNFYSTSGVMRLNSVQNLSEIEYFTAELSTI